MDFKSSLAVIILLLAITPVPTLRHHLACPLVQRCVNKPGRLVHSHEKARLSLACAPFCDANLDLSNGALPFDDHISMDHHKSGPISQDAYLHSKKGKETGSLGCGLRISPRTLTRPEILRCGTRHSRPSGRTSPRHFNLINATAASRCALIRSVLSVARP